MTRLPWNKQRPLAALAGAVLLTSLSASVAGETADGGALDPYRRFAEDERGPRIAGIARRAFLEAAGREEPYAFEPAGPSGRPAGPRDERPAPPWPDGPTGIVLCLRAGGTVRACEGEIAGPAEDLGAAVSRLAGRLAASRSRSRKPVPQRVWAKGSIEVVFAPDLLPLSDAESGSKSRTLPSGWDPALTGFCVRGDGGAAFVMPGEASSIKKAVGIAGRSEAVKRSGGARIIERFTAVRVGELPLVSP
jgi:hypothetical protein